MVRIFFQDNAHHNNSPSWSSNIRAKNVLKNGYNWRAGSGNSSFWFSNRSPHGLLGTLVPIIDIHDLHHSVRDVFSNIGQHTHALYTNLPPNIEDYINNTQLNFNDIQIALFRDVFSNIEDAFIWSHNKNGAYSTKSGYTWLLSLSKSQTNDDIQIAWS